MLTNLQIFTQKDLTEVKIFHKVFWGGLHFLSRISILTHDIDIANLSVRLSVSLMLIVTVVGA